MLSDEAHTCMRLTHDFDETDLGRGLRQTTIPTALSTYGIEDRDGEFVLEVPEERFGTRYFPSSRDCSRSLMWRFCRVSAFDARSWRTSEHC